jgi:hypothetical protein
VAVGDVDHRAARLVAAHARTHGAVGGLGLGQRIRGPRWKRLELLDCDDDLLRDVRRGGAAAQTDDGEHHQQHGENADLPQLRPVIGIGACQHHDDDRHHRQQRESQCL